MKTKKVVVAKPKKVKVVKVKVIKPKVWESSKHEKYESFVDLPPTKKESYVCVFGVPVHRKCVSEKGVDADEMCRVRVINYEIDPKFVNGHMGGLNKAGEELLAERKKAREVK